MKWDYHTHQDQGTRGEQQDDCVVFLSDDSKCCFAVLADGVGGHRGGEIASGAVIETARELWNETPDCPSGPEVFLQKLAKAAHEAVNQTSQDVKTGGRTTLVALIVENGRATWTHSGDSRLYVFSKGEFVQRTADHSIVELLVLAGEITDQEMGTHPSQGRLLQSLGGSEYKQPSVDSCKLTGTESFILCSDGVWEHTAQDEFAKLAFENHSGEKLQKLISTAVERAGEKADNASAIIVYASAPKSPALSIFIALGGVLVLILIYSLLNR